jgi:hypothetical protein
VLAPFCVTASEFGWFTKKPVQAVVKEVMASAAEKNKFRFKFRMIIGPLETPNHPESAYKIVAEQNHTPTYPVPTCDTPCLEVER